MNASVQSPRTSLWALRVLTVVLAAVMGLALASATQDRGSAAGTVANVAWGLVVAALVIDLVVPSPLGLTIVRMVLPLSVPAAALALAYGASPARGVSALALALLATLVAFSAEAGEALVQGGAYGEERRLPLRPPAVVLPFMVVSWVVWAALALVAVLALSDHRWLVGALVAAVGGLLGWMLFVRFHRFSRRWLVLVPAGAVLHDHVVLGETLMLPRPNVVGAALAPADTEAADLTGPAAGHAVEIVVREMVLAVLAATPADPKGKALHVQSLLVAPSRPGRALQAIAAVKIPVG